MWSQDRLFCSFVLFRFVLRIGTVRDSLCADRNDSVTRENLMMTGVGWHFLESCPGVSKKRRLQHTVGTEGERADLGDQQGRSSLTVTEGRQPRRRGARMHGHSLEGFCFLRAIGSKVISSERAGGGGVGHLRGEGTVYRRAGQ